MIPVEQAWQTYARVVRPLAAEVAPISSARGRVLAQAAHTLLDLPPFAQSAMDGYAVRKKDLELAQDARPVELECVQFIAAQAQEAQLELQAGQCARIFTGAMVPSGADAVVMQEKTQVTAGRVQFRQPVELHNNIRFQGEEAAAGFALCPQGQAIDSRVIAAASFAGLAQVQAHRAPRLAVLVTGDELVSPGQHLRAGEVYECNGAFLRAWLAERGVSAAVLRVPDQPGPMRQAMAAALASADLLVVTGGASVGERDYAREVAATLGVQEHFWRVAQKPGKPLAFGMLGDKPVMILPGNPAAVFTCAWLHLDPVLRRLQGQPDFLPAWQSGRVAFAVSAAPTRDRFLRVQWRLDECGQAMLAELPMQASHMLTNLIATNALLRVPADRHVALGSLGQFLPLGPPAQGGIRNLVSTAPVSNQGQSSAC